MLMDHAVMQSTVWHGNRKAKIHPAHRKTSFRMWIFLIIVVLPSIWALVYAFYPDLSHWWFLGREDAEICWFN